jgi:hypothetical protein
MDDYEKSRVKNENYTTLKAQLLDAESTLRSMRVSLHWQNKHVLKIRTAAQKACFHDKTAEERESGHYGQRYTECAECGLRW